MRVTCIIIARGESKGIANKNIIDFCGRPLIAWTILQALSCNLITDVWVSSDSREILNIAKEYGANLILRPKELSMDNSTSESAWIHALDLIEKNNTSDAIDYLICPQVTSPLRSGSDFSNALLSIFRAGADSMLSVGELEDYFIWKLSANGKPKSDNYDYKLRKPRQFIEKKFLENGSFYIFRPQIIKKTNNRLGGTIMFHVMPKYKMFQIDNPEDIEMCKVLMMGYGLNKTS